MPETLLELAQAPGTRQELVLLAVAFKADVDLFPQPIQSRARLVRPAQNVHVGADANAAVHRRRRYKVQIRQKGDERGFQLARSKIFQSPDIPGACAEQLSQTGRRDANAHEPIDDETKLQ